MNDESFESKKPIKTVESNRESSNLESELKSAANLGHKFSSKINNKVTFVAQPD